MLEYVFAVVTQCVADWAAMKSSQFCYLGLVALYLAEYAQVHDRRVYLWGAAMYVTLFLV